MKAYLVRLALSVELHYDIGAPGCDFIFNLHAAHTPHQTVVAETLTLSQPWPQQIYTDPVTRTRYLRLHANSIGPLAVRYNATVDIRHYSAEPRHIQEVPVAELPGEVLIYIYPSRYCPSDRLYRLAAREFGHLWHGYSRVQAICAWVQRNVKFCSNTSDSTTTAVDTLVSGAGVCRDFAHLMIALCRAINIPARFVTGTDYGADPALGPPDFHAYVEVYLSGRWYLFDPSGTAIPMGLVRLATGRDAADCAFATMFGSVVGTAPIIRIEPVPNAEGMLVQPWRTQLALSTDAQVLGAPTLPPSPAVTPAGVPAAGLSCP